MELHSADGAFVCGSGAGIVPIGSFDGRPVTRPEHPLIARIQDAYRERTQSPEFRTDLYIGAS
jgi:branched-chain amino acid aminotransferase